MCQVNQLFMPFPLILMFSSWIMHFQLPLLTYVGPCGIFPRISMWLQIIKRKMNIHIVPSLKAELYNSNCFVLGISLLFGKKMAAVIANISIVVKINHHLFILNCNKEIKQQMPVKRLSSHWEFLGSQKVVLHCSIVAGGQVCIFGSV